MCEDGAEEVSKVAETPFHKEEDGEARCALERVVLVDLGQLGKQPTDYGQRAQQRRDKGEIGRDASMECRREGLEILGLWITMCWKLRLKCFYCLP